MELDSMLSGILVISLVIGMLIGVTTLSLIGVKLGLAELPEGVGFRQIIGVSLLAGVGFTMSIFVANLAFFDSPQLLDSAKMGIIAGSLIAGISGYLVLRSGKKITDQ